MSERTILSKRFQILSLLYQYPEGLGVRDMIREGMKRTDLKRWLRELEHDGLLRVEVQGKKTTRSKRVHIITSRGITFVTKHFPTQKILNRFLQIYEVKTAEKGIEVMVQVFREMFAYATKRFSEDKGELLRKIFDDLNFAIMDDINESWLSKKDDLAQHLKNKAEVLKRLGEKETSLDTEDITGDYKFQDLRRFNYPLGFIIADAESAWDKGHYLNTHHRYVLENLSIHSKEEIEKKNADWKIKYVNWNMDIVKKEIEERLKEFKTQIKALLPNQKLVKANIPVIREIGIKTEENIFAEPPEKYSHLPNWMHDLDKGKFDSYGGAFWDIR